MIIAVDGPAASGKGTLARRLAEYFDLAHLDTGLLYRAVGHGVLEAGGDPADPKAAEAVARALTLAAVRDPALRGDAAGNAASQVAALPGVRAALVELQRRFAHSPPGGKKGAVLDGRDIGTIICLMPRQSSTSPQAARCAPSGAIRSCSSAGLTVYIPASCRTLRSATRGMPRARRHRSSPRPTLSCSIPARSMRIRLSKPRSTTS